jgi:ABC-type oligopeptide transport system ATPase subunit
MQDGQVREAGPTSEVVNFPKHPYTKSLLQAVMDLEPERQPER